LKGLKLFVETELAKEIFPALKDKITFGMRVFKYLPKDTTFELAIAGLFCGCGTDEAMQNLEILKLSTNKLKYINSLLEKREYLNQPLSLAELKMIVSQPYYEDLYALQKAVLKAERKKSAALMAVGRRAKALAGKDLRPKPLLNGHELMALGAQSGPQVGHVSKELYIEQLSERIASKEDAKKWVENWIKKHKS
jgi:poly(A) polymerase